MGKVLIIGAGGVGTVNSQTAAIFRPLPTAVTSSARNVPSNSLLKIIAHGTYVAGM